MFQIEYKTYIDNKWVPISKMDLPLGKVLDLIEKTTIKHNAKMGLIGEYRVTRIKNEDSVERETGSSDA